jgi:hypothetical protein
MPQNSEKFEMETCPRCKGTGSEFEWTRGGLSYSEVLCSKCKGAKEIRKASKVQSAAEALASVLIGETVVTNDRVLNYVLTHAGEIIGRRDMAPLAKFETLYAYLLKARREVLGAVET